MYVDWNIKVVLIIAMLCKVNTMECCAQ